MKGFRRWWRSVTGLERVIVVAIVAILILLVIGSVVGAPQGPHRRGLSMPECSTWCNGLVGKWDADHAYTETGVGSGVGPDGRITTITTSHTERDTYCECMRPEP